VVKNIKTYFILVLYLAFTIGIAIEKHSACNSCESGHCNIELSNSENEHDCHHSSCKISKTENTEHHCNCTTKEYKINNDYVNEDKLRIFTNQDFSFNILYTIFHPEILFQKIAKGYPYYIKILDRKLFHKLSIYELSSILC